MTLTNRIQAGYNQVYREREVNFDKVVSIVNDSIERGIHVDMGKLQTELEELESNYATKYNRLRDLTWGDFNVNGRNDIKALFTEQYDCEHLAGTTKTGNLSFNAETLEKIYAEEQIEEALLIMEIRSLKSIGNKLVELGEACGEPDQNNIATVHPDWEYSDTFRIYYKKPGLSNISYGIRHIFVAPPEYKILSIDVSQEEPTIMFNWMCPDKTILGLMKEHGDFYKAFAAYMLDKDDLTPDERGKAKTAWLAGSYGAGVPTIAKEIGIDDAKLFFSKLNNIPTLKEYKAEIRNKMKQKDYLVHGYFGTPREIPNRGWGYVERAMLNTPIQTTGSELLHFAIEDIDIYCEENGLTREDVRFYLGIHDEVLLLVHNDHVHHADNLSNILKFKIDDWEPLRVSTTLSESYS